ncbi:MAG: S16 family serine protease [Candidatus Micrarchaeota archaeon]
MRKLAVLLCILVFSSLALAQTALQVPAVDTGGKGVLTQIEAEVIPGNGGVFIDIEPYISVDTQQSARTAAQIAAKEAGADLDNYNVLFKIVAKTQIVDGPSGGAAMALLAYSEFAKRKPRNDLALTGTIERDGSIGGVGGVWEKTLSLRDKGIRLFLIPKGQSQYQSRNIAVEAQQFGVQVVEVRNLKDVIKYAFTLTGSAVESQSFADESLALQKIDLPSSLNPLKELAEGEIDELETMEKQLGSNNESTALRESIGRTVNESRYLLERGYYYSAANEVFVAKMSAEAFSMRDVEQIEFMKMVQTLENDAEEISFENETIENLEWVIGAKLRYYWALDKITGIKKSIGLVDSQELHSEYVAAKNWISAARKMNEIAKKTGGQTKANTLAAMAYAEKILKSLNETQEYLLDTEVSQHYSGALRAYGKGDYSTAVFDGLFAKAMADAGNRIAEQTGSDFEKSIRGIGDLNRYESSVWAQYYFAHSLYSVAQANRTNEFSYTANAIKLQELSEALREQMPYLKQLLQQEGLNASQTIPFPVSDDSEPGKFKIETRIITPQQSKETQFVLALMGLAALVLLVLLGRLALRRFARPSKPLAPAEKIEKIDELLLHGKISERNWEILHERYFRQLKQASAKTGKRKGYNSKR